MNARGGGGPAIGVIGLGLLGSAIVERLRAAGRRLSGFDIDASRVRELDVEARGSAAEVAAEADLVLLCLPDSAAVEDVVEGAGGILEADGPLRLVVDTTTGEPERSRALAARLRARDIGFVEAAVSGSSEDMRRGDAVLLVGASHEDLARARDVLDDLAPVIYRLGGVGAGLEAKLASNLLLGLQRLAFAESLLFAEKLGLSPATMLEVLRAGPAYARVMDTKGLKMIRGDFEPEARLAQHLKDVRLVLEEARRTGTLLPLSRLHRRILERGVASGLGDRDNCVVLEVLRALDKEETV